MIRKIVLIMIMSLSSLSYGMASDLRCGDDIVTVGDTTYDVLMKCKEPRYTDNSEIEVIKEVRHGEWEKIHLKMEIWLFNFGPGHHMKKLNFVNGKLKEIKNLGYGYLEKDIGSFGNKESKLYIQMSKPEALIHWGEPDHKTSVIEERLYRVEDKEFLKYNVTISKWIYNFGPNQFLKTLVFENDQLIEIKSGKYGYDK